LESSDRKPAALSAHLKWFYGLIIPSGLLSQSASFLSVQLGVFFLTGRYFSVHVDSADGADRLASAALDALIRVDVEHGLAVKFINTVNGTDAYTGFVFNADARFSNNEWHGYYLQYK